MTEKFQPNIYTSKRYHNKIFIFYLRQKYKLNAINVVDNVLLISYSSFKNIKTIVAPRFLN